MEQVFDAGRHAVERRGQVPELIPRLDADPVGEVSLLHTFGTVEELVDRRRDRCDQHGAHDERRPLDDQEQDAEQYQQLQQHGPAVSERGAQLGGIHGRQPVVQVAHRRDQPHGHRTASATVVPVRALEERDRLAEDRPS
jgi:hypothetical protein